MYRRKKIESYIEYGYTVLENNLISIIQKPIATIMMLHHVNETSIYRINCLKDNSITPDFLENTIKWLLDKKFEFVSISDLEHALNNNLWDGNGRKLVISIDDGYKDTYDKAFPIFEKYKIPFIFYVSSAFPDKTVLLWWKYLNDIISLNDKIQLNNGNVLLCDTYEKKQKVYISLSKKILRMGNNINNDFNKLFKNSIEEIIEKYKELLIDWQSIKEMSMSEFCSIGAHSTNHIGLRYCDSEYVMADIIKNKRKIEEIIGKDVRHFAYPFGTHFSVGRRDYKLAIKAGFATATATYSSDVFPYHKNNLYCLPRKMLHE